MAVRAAAALAAFHRAAADGGESGGWSGAARLDEIRRRQHSRQAPDPVSGAGGPSAARCGGGSGNYFLLAHAAALESSAAHDRRIAQASAGAHRPAPGFLPRFEQNRGAGHAHHERRRRPAEFDRHRPRGICGQPDNRAFRAVRVGENQRGDDQHRALDPDRLRGGAESGIRHHSPDLSRAVAIERGSYRPSHRITRAACAW